MRISDLGREVGLPVATIKFYLREGLLPRGNPTGRNQAEYGAAHLRRLRLIRSLTTVGELDLSSVRRVLDAIEDHGLPLHDLYRVVNRATFPEQQAYTDADSTPSATQKVDDLIDETGWQIPPDAPDRLRLGLVLAALERLGCECGFEFFMPYAEVAEMLIRREVSLLPDTAAECDRGAIAARAVLLDVAFTAMRRMAQEHVVTDRFPLTPGTPAKKPC